MDLKEAEENGYQIREVALTYATSWWVWKAGKLNRFVKSKAVALELIDGHMKRSLGQ